MVKGNIPTEKHPIVRAVLAMLEVRDALLDAVKMRAGDDATADAGRFAEAVLAFGGAVPDESNPWDLKHALEPTPGVVDAAGADLLERFAHLVGMCLRGGERAKKLGLSAQPLLARFAALAMKHKTRAATKDALDAAKVEDERARQRAHREAHEKRGNPGAPATKVPAGLEPPPRPKAPTPKVG
jgi:outer membrane murein-binding lipoprotein Lpp